MGQAGKDCQEGVCPTGTLSCSSHTPSFAWDQPRGVDVSTWSAELEVRTADSRPTSLSNSFMVLPKAQLP